MEGSSPLTRGAPALTLSWWCANRIIPAHAGSTGRGRVLRRGCGDHPRSRGEHATPHKAEQFPHGSSPLTRGAPASQTRVAHPPGIIPAHAGSTDWGAWRLASGRDHPRSRGEHKNRVVTHAAFSGSSPLTRGARIATGAAHFCLGIIPAHAGSTAPSKKPHGAVGDHPRSRGEHANPARPTRKRPGSSPLTRGAPCPGVSSVSAIRIIPAHAGSTNRSARILFGPGDHPRSRGEHQEFAGSHILHPLRQQARHRRRQTHRPRRLRGLRCPLHPRAATPLPCARHPDDWHGTV